jgi:hypothetical protein
MRDDKQRHVHRAGRLAPRQHVGGYAEERIVEEPPDRTFHGATDV